MFVPTSHVNAEGDCPSGKDRRCLADVLRRATKMLALMSYVNAEDDCPSGEDRRCLADVLRRATDMFAPTKIRERRRRQARGGFPANINLAAY